jgi:hypothetical protein
MRKKIFFNIILFVLVLLPFFYFTAKNANAQKEFIVDAQVTYELDKEGNTKVINNITLENIFPTLYAKSYTLTLDNIELKNVRAYQGNQSLKIEESEEGDKTNLKVNFDDILVGKGEKRNFSVEFDVDNFATRTGEVWEISIPKLSDETAFRDYKVILSVPTFFGNKAYMSPDPAEEYIQAGKNIYVFNKEAISKTGISAGFGEFQVFSFILNYHLENPLNKKAETKIPIPPDTAFQKVYYDKINPGPEEIEIDSDGNWLATFILSPRERLDITTSGSVQIFATERSFMMPSIETLAKNTTSTQYWQKDDPVIKELSKDLNTPKKIYDYVTQTLNYDYNRVRPNVQRLGATESLKQPNSAICMEFTDLFIALARSAGIPAREINGYAYTENPEIQPLSLVADVLHSWPEYWDSKRNAWIPVDPTWGKTTGGIDYFNKLDLRHFTFVVHGSDPEKPYAPGSYKLGPNPQKDVFVNFGKLPEERNSELKLTAEVSQKLPFLGSEITVNIYNPGPVALYNLEPVVNLDNKAIPQTKISVLPPFSSYDFTVKIPFSFLGRNTPKSISIEANSEVLAIPGNKTSVIINSLVFLFIILTLVLSFVFIRHKKIKPPHLNLKKLFKKNEVKSEKVSQNPKDS